MPHFSQQNTQVQTMKVVPEQALMKEESYMSNNTCKHRASTERNRCTTTHARTKQARDRHHVLVKRPVNFEQ